jgi:hypothetical protein
MKISNAELLTAVEGAHAISRTKLHTDAILSLRRFLRRLKEHVDDYNEARKALAEEYADRDERTGDVLQGETPGSYQITRRRVEFNRAHLELLEARVEVDATLSIQELRRGYRVRDPQGNVVEMEPVLDGDAVLALGELLTDAEP